MAQPVKYIYQKGTHYSKVIIGSEFLITQNDGNIWNAG